MCAKILMNYILMPEIQALNSVSPHISKINESKNTMFFYWRKEKKKEFFFIPKGEYFSVQIWIIVIFHPQNWFIAKILFAQLILILK